MTSEVEGGAVLAAIDRTLREWRQGDCSLGEHWFAFRVDPRLCLTAAAKAAAELGGDLAESLELGFVVLTQTCDIVRFCKERPFLEVCPLVEVTAEVLKDIERGRRPAYAALPLLADLRLVADLDRVMTVEKTLVATWQRSPGLSSDKDARRFSEALARKRARFAFPDDFSLLARRLAARLSEKHERASVEGQALRGLREVRVQAAPSWDSPEIELTLWFIRGTSEVSFENKSWADLLETWLGLVPATGRFKRVGGVVVSLSDLTAGEYVDSDPFDLDHLSSAG